MQLTIEKNYSPHLPDNSNNGVHAPEISYEAACDICGKYKLTRSRAACLNTYFFTASENGTIIILVTAPNEKAG